MTKWLFLFVAGVVGCASQPSQNGPVTVKKEIFDQNMISKQDKTGVRKRLMVLPFLDVSTTRSQELRDQSRAEFVRELSRHPSLIVIDSKDLKLDVVAAQTKGEYDIANMTRAATQLGVHALLEGKVLDLKVQRISDPVGVFRQVKTRFEAQVRARVFTARNGKEVFNTIKTVSVEEASTRVGEKVDSDRFLVQNPEIVEKLLKEAFMDFIPQIAASLDRTQWEGRIAAIQGDRIYLNVGAISGVQVGDLLKVSDEAEEIYDPHTGTFIGKPPGRMKGTLEVVSFFGQDGAIAVVHSGAGFKESDRVSLY